MQQKEAGVSSDYLDAVFERANLLRGEPIMSVVWRVRALRDLLQSEVGRDLLGGCKRATNFLDAEELKGTTVTGDVRSEYLYDPAEKALNKALNQAENKVAQAIQNEDFSAAMVALGALREPIDSFFEKVLVNDQDEAVRANRLALLARVRAATNQVADFSKIAG